MGSTEFPMAVMGFIGFYRVLPSFIGFSIVFLEFFWVLPGLT